VPNQALSQQKRCDVALFSERLRESVAKLGISMKEFSRRTGIPYRTLMGYVTNRSMPGADVLIRMAEQGVDINKLLLKDTPRNTIPIEIIEQIVQDPEYQDLSDKIEKQSRLLSLKFLKKLYKEEPESFNVDNVFIMEDIFRTTLWEHYGILVELAMRNPDLFKGDSSKLEETFGKDLLEMLRSKRYPAALARDSQSD